MALQPMSRLICTRSAQCGVASRRITMASSGKTTGVCTRISEASSERDTTCDTPYRP